MLLPAAILFDLGHTLITSATDFDAFAPLMHRAAASFLQAQGCPLDERAFVFRFGQEQQAYFTQRDDDLAERTMGEVLSRLLDEFRLVVPAPVQRAALRTMYAVSQAEWQTVDGALETLDALRRRGILLAVVSNASDDDNVQALVDAHRLRPYLEFALSSAAFGLRKPAPEIFREALRRLGVLPAEAVMVGDTYAADILGAQAVGIPAVWFSRYAPPLPAGAVSRPEAQITALPDLLPLFDSGLPAR